MLGLEREGLGREQHELGLFPRELLDRHLRILLGLRLEIRRSQWVARTRDDMPALCRILSYKLETDTPIRAGNQYGELVVVIYGIIHAHMTSKIGKNSQSIRSSVQ